MPAAVADLSALRSRLRALERGGAVMERSAVKLGDPALDKALPWGGLARGGVHQLEGLAGEASVSGFAAGLAARCTGPEGRLLWLRLRRDRQEAGLPYGPGLARYGIATDRLILAEADSAAALLWALEEALRCGALSVALAEGVAPDLTASRRLQLAAEASGVTALLVSHGPAPTRSAALTRWRVAAAPSPEGVHCPRWQVELLRCRGGRPGSWMLEWKNAALGFSVVPALAGRALAQAV
jgi:protein ImuA